MDIKELKKRKLELERYLRMLIQNKVDEFHDETGIWLDDVYISIDQINELDKEDPVGVLIKTDVRINL